MTIYKTYMKTIPKEFREISGSFCNKPIGGLWGCRGEEWKEWCEQERFALDKLKTCFTWRLKRGSKVYRIRHKADFNYLIKKYPLMDNNQVISIDYIAVSKDYDAVETVGNIVSELRFNEGSCLCELMGLYAWDVPSICVLNTDKVVLL